ncbi:hypothetical protein EIK76_03035 [Rheinheimera mesophila]|uniref:Flagellar hook-length control protein FliK n=1 Tax=Rheinheimera mesophila TaxID=1547515 RepID=A0A3P3QQR0_9GAMM|nr:hypothetical protein [Rheinheimera mesophila]RRJ23078.1 hypothetical protein EIK76_03035 [Rheinheimera mesophila]
MNQITLDSALSAQTKGAVPAAVLVEEHNYQALLNIGKDGMGQLKLQSPSGMVLIQDAKLNLPALQGQLMVQLTQALSGQLQVKLSQNGPPPMPVQLTQPQLQQVLTQLSAHIATPSHSQLSTQLATQLQTQSSTHLAKVVQVQVQIQRQDQQLLLQVGQTKVQLPLPAALQSLAASQWLDATLQFKAGQLSLMLPKAALLPTTVDPKAASELLTVPLKMQPSSPSPKNQPVAAGHTATQIKMPAPTSTPQSIISLSAPVQQRILPLVLPQLTTTFSGTVLSINELKQLPLPAATKQQLADPQYQLQLTPQGQLQLKAIPEQKTVLIDAQPKVFQLQSSKTESHQGTAAQLDPARLIKPQLEPAALNQAWRQLLPMLDPEWDNLAETPELPPAVKAILQLVRQSQPDASKLTNLAQLPAQLQALLQFNPLQNVTMPQTAAGTLAVAIQLLLGRLGQTLPQNDKGPNKDHKLKDFVAQLDQTQSSQLLKQLSSHSSSLQHAQLATLEQQSKDPLQQIFLTLPIQNQQVSDFCQIAISQQEEEQENGKGKSAAWQLSMKFDLKQLGQLLAISKLSGSSLSLQLYTDTSMLKLLAEKYLPLLKDRCKAQGIDVKEAHCQLGKIPESLMPKTTSLLAIRV